MSLAAARAERIPIHDTGSAEKGAGTAEIGEYRSPFQRDRDRILYCSAFRRLAEITQVVPPSVGYRVHNRLTHVLKVAQIGRRMAEALLKKSPGLAEDVDAHGLDPDVVETAALAHDLGHPPFGHIAEHELNEILITHGLTDGFEGNAQSFRIVTRLESKGFTPQIESEQWLGLGLNLTRATLNAILKYPWPRQRTGKPANKWGVYDTEKDIFDTVRQGSDPDQPCLEAQIMDWADDLAYGVHDFEDFFRAKIIPFMELRDELKLKTFVEESAKRRSITCEKAQAEFQKTTELLLKRFPVKEVYDGSDAQRAALKSFSNQIVGRAMEGTKVEKGKLIRPPDVEAEINVFKQMTWHYVIEGPQLATTQVGHRVIIKAVLNHVVTAAKENKLAFFTSSQRNRLMRLYRSLQDMPANTPQEDIKKVENEVLRVAVDIVSNLAEKELVDLYSKLTGLSAIVDLQ